jgi:hypothetical protein
VPCSRTSTQLASTSGPEGPGDRGSVVTAAGLVFAFIMASFIFSDLRVLGTIGTTIALSAVG